MSADRALPQGAASGAGHGAAGLLRELLIASRPLSWIDTALPFLAAALQVERSFDPAVLLGTVYFLVPFNLLMYGVNDIFDFESDLANPRKRSLEGGIVPPDRRRITWLAIAATNLPCLVAFALLAPPAATIAVLLAALAAVIYSAPPLRTKERPFADSLTSASHFVLPAVAGFLAAGMAVGDLPWPFIVGFAAWGVASHALGAIQDVSYDRAAGIGSIATAIGARPTAWVSLAAYASAVAIGLWYGGPAIVAALALATYLLLPLAVLCRPTEAQARRAWRSFLGLNLLVGFVLTQLLLHEWGVTARSGGTILWIGAVAALGVCLLQLTASTVALRRARDTGPVGTAHAAGPGLPLLTVVVPCRNEAARLPALLEALARQDHPDLEVIVVDDGSTDGSPVLAREHLARLRPTRRAVDRVVSAPTPPAGWAGKSWACAAGAAAATGGHVLFLDADTVPARRALSTLHRLALDRQAQLVSGLSRYAMPSGPERRWVPGFPMTIRGLVPVWLSVAMGGRWARAGFAYGPLLLVDRAAYERTGGHAATPGSQREDLDLARTMASGPGSVLVVDATDLASTRHYPDGRGSLRAWRRVGLAYAGDSFATLLTLVAIEMLAWIAPLILPVAGWLAGDVEVLLGGLGSLGLLIAFRVGAALAGREPLGSILWHPLTVAGTVAAQLASLADGVRGVPPIWHGRPYEPGT